MITLYGHPYSNNARKVHWALEELELPYVYKTVDLMKGEQKQSEFLRLNPLGRVPVIQDGDVVMFESNAILSYLEERYGKGKLAPTEPERRAEVHEWLWWQASDLAKPMLDAFMSKFLASMGMAPLDEAKHKTLIAATQAPLDAIEHQLKNREYIASGQFTMADIAIAESVGLSDTAGIGLGGRPNVKNWYARLSERSGFKKTRPTG